MNTRDEILDADQYAMKALTQAPMSIVLTNPRLQDNPIVYVNSAFEKVTGYSSEAAVGRNCRFLQGKDTDPETVQVLRDAVAEGREVAVELRNYRADGTPFNNRLMISPLEDTDGKVAFFMGVQMAIDDKDSEIARMLRSREIENVLSELQHRVKNHLSMIVGMIRLQARRSSASRDFGTLSRRIEALQLLYEELGKTSADRVNDAQISLGAYISRVGNAIGHIDGRSGVRVNIDADAVSVPFEVATRVGLIVSEILTNALQHAFEGRDAGIVELRVKELSDGIVRISVTDDGIGMSENATWPEGGNLGSRIVKSLLDEMDATVSVQTANQGTTISFDLPVNDDL